MLGDKDVCATIAVKDMEAAKKFYGETLGLEASMETPAGIFYKSGNSGVFVYPSNVAGTNQATYAAWTVEDVEGAVEGLKAKGVSFEHYPDLPDVTVDGDIHTMGDMKAVWFKDPEGNILNIVNKVG
ncbi:MAG TPA: VOC family protein [Candidatus Saccharimonadales bacterium]|nr:VOC family protein [Candidatus Saccharimonadales bacterium]